MGRPDRGGIDITDGAPASRSMEVGRFRLSTARFRGGHRIASHYHDRACLSVILDGFFLQRFPGLTCECPMGGLIIKPPGERHDDQWGDAPTWHIMIEPLSVDDGLGPLRPVFEEVAYRIDVEIAALGRKLAGELVRPDDLAALSAEALATRIVVKAGRPEPSSGGRDRPGWLTRIRELLEDRYRESLRLQDLAAAADVHPSRLSREFRRHYGVSPAAYMRAVRLQRARIDLETTGLDLSAVAFRHGFSDQSHMTRALREATGLTPAVYRRVRGNRRPRPVTDRVPVARRAPPGPAVRQ